MSANGLPLVLSPTSKSSARGGKQRLTIRHLVSWMGAIQLAPTPLARYQAARHRRQPVEKPDATAISRYRLELSTLADAIPCERVNWYLEGGMALAAHFGKFVRTHSDVDIGLFADHVYEFEACLAEHNYRLFSRNPHTHAFEYSKFDVVRATDSEEISTRPRVKRLTAIKVNGRGRVDWHASVLPRFDVHIHRRGQNVVYLTNRRFAFPEDLFFQNVLYETANQRRIQLASMPFLYFFKLQGRRPKQMFDRRLIEDNRLLSADDAGRVKAALAS